MSSRSSAEPLFAVTPPGLEKVAAAELSELGIHGTVEPGGVAWEGTREQLYTANLCLRTASRVLLRVGNFRARTFFELERHAGRVPWERFVGAGRRVQLRVTCRKSRLYHEGAVAERVLAAIGARVSGVASADPASEEEAGVDTQLFVIRFLHDRCTVSADTSGALLHQRGYRQQLAKAPLRETLAAGMLLASGWRAQAPLLDPMCGAGTIPIEAALIARKIPPGLAGAERGPRDYAFRHWPELDTALWQHIAQHARDGILPTAPVAIAGSDRDAGAIEASRANAERAGVASDVGLFVRPLSAIEPPTGEGWLVTNPPYGVRVGEADALRNLYAALGRTARHRLPGWTLVWLSADRRLDAQVAGGVTELLRTRNGGIFVRLVRTRFGRQAPGGPVSPGSTDGATHPGEGTPHPPA